MLKFTSMNVCRFFHKFFLSTIKDSDNVNVERCLESTGPSRANTAPRHQMLKG